jgi:hypothetical protein
MPELPEVETITRGLDTRLSGDAIESVWIGSRKQPLKSPAGVIAATLEGKRIVRVHRAGKHIVFDLEGQSRSKKGNRSAQTAQWIVHLGMTGRMVVSEPAAIIAKHTHLIAKLGSGRELRFVDPRMFGKLSVHAGGFDPGGVEPLEVDDQERAVESEVAARRWQHLCRRVVISGWPPASPAGNNHHATATGQVAPGSAGSVARGDCARRLVDFRLCGCRWRRRIFPASASGVWPRGGSVSGVRERNPAGRDRRTKQSLLPKMSKIAVVERLNIDELAPAL